MILVPVGFREMIMVVLRFPCSLVKEIPMANAKDHGRLHGERSVAVASFLKFTRKQILQFGSLVNSPLSVFRERILVKGF